MIDWLASRSTVIALAVIGGVISLVASSFHSNGRFSDEVARFVSRIGYAFMWTSIALFIFAGFRLGWQG